MEGLGWSPCHAYVWPRGMVVFCDLAAPFSAESHGLPSEASSESAVNRRIVGRDARQIKTDLL